MVSRDACPREHILFSHSFPQTHSFLQPKVLIIIPNMAIKRESDVDTDCIAESSKRQRTVEQENLSFASTPELSSAVPNAHDNATNNVAPIEPEIIEEDGDLTIRIMAPKDDTADEHEGHNYAVAEFRTDAGVLRRASSILKAKIDMNRPPADEPWIVELPYHHLKAVSTVLHILHCRKPRKYSISEEWFEHLYHVTLFTASYNLTRHLQLVADQWNRTLREHHRTRKQKDPFYLRNLLWIAWEIGALQLFKDVIQQTSGHCGIDASGELVFLHEDSTTALKMITGNMVFPCLQEQSKTTTKQLAYLSIY